MKCKCHGCEKRHQACWGICEDYKLYANELDAQKADRKKNYMFDDYEINNDWKRK